MNRNVEGILIAVGALALVVGGTAVAAAMTKPNQAALQLSVQPGASFSQSVLGSSPLAISIPGNFGSATLDGASYGASIASPASGGSIMNIAAGTLSTGTHALVLTWTDSSNASQTATVTLNVS